MPAFERSVLLCFAFALLARACDPTDGSCDVAEPDFADDAADLADVGAEHMLLLQTGVQHKAPPALQQGKAEAAVEYNMTQSAGERAMAAIMASDPVKVMRQAPLASPLCGAGANATVTLPSPGAWTGLMLMDSLDVHVTTGVAADYINVTGFSNLLPHFKSQLSYFGTLVLSSTPNLCNSNLQVDIGVTAPLSHAVNIGATLVADSVAGPVSASAGGSAAVLNLASTQASLDSSDRSTIFVRGGTVAFLSVSASSGARVAFGEDLTAGVASLTASSYGVITGVNVNTASISASSGGYVAATVSESAGLSCSSGASVNITGPGAVSVWSSTGCAAIAR